jgi:DNA-binding transcriptional MerR regulator
MTMTSMSPREAARAAGVSTDTLRHYERLGLLPGVARTRSGYRRYSPANVERVVLIQRSLVIGFSLDDLSRVLAERDKGGAPCRKVRALVAARLEALTQRIDELHALQHDLTVLLRDWDARLSRTRDGEQAHLLTTLGTRTVERVRKTRAMRDARRHLPGS